MEVRTELNRAILTDQHVVRFDVSVDTVEAVDVTESLKDLCRDETEQLRFIDL